MKFPEEHDCDKCDKSDVCPAFNVIPWIDEHKGELEEASDRQREAISAACATFIEMFPDMRDKKQMVVNFIMSGFALGYYEAKHLTPIPKAFKDW